MSGLAEIYAAVAATAVSVAGKTPVVFDHDALPAAVNTAQLPCRVLLPVGRLDGLAEPLALGGGRVIRWRLTDLLLLAAVGQGRDIGEHSAALVAYCEAYAVALGGGLEVIGGRVSVTRIEFEMGVYAYPPEHGTRFYGVACTLTVEEIA